MKHYSHVKPVSIGTNNYSLHVSLHWIRAQTNPVKIWNRYAGCLVLKGTGTYEDWDGNIHYVEPGMFVHHFPEKFHHIERDTEEGWEECTIGIDAKLYCHYRDLGWIDDSRPVVMVGTSKDIIDSFARLASNLEKSKEQDGGWLLHETGQLLLRIKSLADNIQERTPEEILIENACQQLVQDFRCELDLPALAEESGFSYPHFRRIFRQLTRMSPGAYRNEQRMEQARLLLAYRHLRVSEVAERLGYSDQFVFSRQFKKRFKISPKHYAEKYRMQ